MQTLDRIKWTGSFKLEKFYADDPRKPFEVITAKNLLLTAGATAMWQKLAGQGSVTSFDATNTYVCVGNGTTAPAAGQTDLQGASKTRKLVDSAPVISGAGITFISTFGSSDANHSWDEAGIANHTSAGVLLNRVVQAFGVKTSGFIWVMTGSISMA